jgi:transketolase
MVTLAKAGRMIGMKTFGASAPLKELHGKFGFEPGRVVEAAKELLGTPTTDTGLRESQHY